LSKNERAHDSCTDWNSCSNIGSNREAKPAREIDRLQAMRKATRKSDRERELIQLWREKPEDQRTGNDVLAFYGWLIENGLRDLLPPAKMEGEDQYQSLKAFLAPYVRDK
jgi:hypothetical protein